jgi:hypothetical protein
MILSSLLWRKWQTGQWTAFPCLHQDPGSGKLLTRLAFNTESGPDTAK